MATDTLTVVAIIATVAAILVPAVIFLLWKWINKSSVKHEVGPYELSIATSCLGRNFKVGMLYNAHNNTSLTDKMLWNESTLQSACISEKKQVKHDFDVITNDSLQTKLYHLGVKSDLSLSLVSDLVNVSKSADYLHDHRTSTQQARVVLKYQCTTKTKKLTMDLKKPAKFSSPQILQDGKATHVVVGVTYGTEVYFIFDKDVLDDEECDEMCREMEKLVAKLPNVAKGKKKLSEKEDCLARELRCSVYTDCQLHFIPRTFNDAITVCKSILKSTDVTDIVPKIAWLYPLHYLDESVPVVQAIEPQLVQGTIDQLDMFNSLDMKANELLKLQICSHFTGISSQLEQFKKFINEQRCELKEKLKVLTPQIRQCQSSAADLNDFIESSQESVTSSESWLKEKRRELDCLSQYLQVLNVEGVRFALNKSKFHSYVKNELNVISFEFIVGRKEDFTFDETSWSDNVELTSNIQIKSEKFTAFAQDNKGTTCVVTISSDSSLLEDEGVVIRRYEAGSLDPKYFEFPQFKSPPPTKPRPTANHRQPSLGPDISTDTHSSRLAVQVTNDASLSIRSTESSDEALKIYKLNIKTVMSKISHNISKCEFGARNPLKPTKVVMVMGATGAGKSTLINGMVNYILGVKYEDNFRFKLICDESSQSQAHSQTDTVTAYTFYWQEGFAVPYNLTIIDTPGFGDTRGLKRDREISNQVKHLFSDGGNNGIDQINAIGFVTQSDCVRLTPTQKYIFESILAIFGNDIEKNIFVMATFADSSKPAVLEAVKEAKIPYTEFFRFNNSSLFQASQKQLAKSFWGMGYSSFETFFQHMQQVDAVSLQLTREVLKEREQLETVLNGIRPKLQEGLSKIDTLRKEETILRERESDIAANKNFTYDIKVTKQRKIELQLGTFVTNCLTCNLTCHYPCAIPDDGAKYRCAAMDTHDASTAKCTVCPKKCSWQAHRNNPYYFECYEEIETRTSENLLKRYNAAETGKIDVEAVISNLHDEINELSRKVYNDIREARRCIERLGEIALKPNPMTEVEYLDLLITSEESERKEGYQDRVQSFKKLKRQAEAMSTMTDEEIEKALSEKDITKWNFLSW